MKHGGFALTHTRGAAGVDAAGQEVTDGVWSPWAPNGSAEGLFFAFRPDVCGFRRHPWTGFDSHGKKGSFKRLSEASAVSLHVTQPGGSKVQPGKQNQMKAKQKPLNKDVKNGTGNGSRAD